MKAARLSHSSAQLSMSHMAGVWRHTHGTPNAQMHTWRATATTTATAATAAMNAITLLLSLLLWQLWWSVTLRLNVPHQHRKQGPCCHPWCHSWCLLADSRAARSCNASASSPAATPLLPLPPVGAACCPSAADARLGRLCGRQGVGSRLEQEVFVTDQSAFVTQQERKQQQDNADSDANPSPAQAEMMHCTLALAVLAVVIRCRCICSVQCSAV